MDLTSIWPTWGSTGDKPTDGKDYETGDNPKADNFDYLWYQIKETFSKVETALSNKADDPHGNGAHSSTFAVDGDAQPPEQHGNGAHSSTFAVDGDAQPPEQHGNGAHSSTFAVDGDAQPPEQHGNSAHSQNYLSEPLAPALIGSFGTADYKLETETNNGTGEFIQIQNTGGVRGPVFQTGVSTSHPSPTIEIAGVTRLETGIVLSESKAYIGEVPDNSTGLTDVGIKIGEGKFVMYDSNENKIGEITQNGDLNLAGTVNENAF